MIRIGVVGLGFMGMIHFYATRKVRGAKVTAICTRNPQKRNGDWRSIQGNFGPRGQKEDISGIHQFDDIDQLIHSPDVDMVDICLPCDMHREIAIAALQAGKHVFVEKSIALEIADANAMVRAAKKSGKLLMVAHVLPYFPEFAFARSCIENERYGKLTGAHFKRIISQPDWSSDFSDLAKTGGPAIDLHIHDTHFIRLVCGMPKSVYSTGVVQDGYVQYLTTQYRFTDNPNLSVSASSGAIAQAGRSFNHGFEIYLENATLLYEFSTLAGKANLTMPLSVLTENGKVLHPKLPGPRNTNTSKPQDDPSITAFSAEIRDAVNAIQSTKEAPILSGSLARDALLLCHKECQSVKNGRSIKLG